MKSYFLNSLLLLLSTPIFLVAQSGTPPKYSIDLFNNGTFILEYDEVRLVEEEDGKTTYYNNGKEEIRYETYMVFQLFRAENPIMEIEITANDGYFLDGYYFLDEATDLLVMELSDDNEDYISKICKDILITSPVFKDKTVFDWSRRLTVKGLDNINSPYEDYFPMLSGDGNTLFFLRAGDPNNSMTFIHEKMNNQQPIRFDQLDAALLAAIKADGMDTPAYRKQALEEQQKKHRQFINAARKASKAENAERAGEGLDIDSPFDTDILISKKSNGVFQNVIRQDFPLNDWSPNFFVGISSDGKRIYTESKDLGKAYNTEGKKDFYSFMEFDYDNGAQSYDFNGNYTSFENMHNVFKVSYFMTLNNNAILCGFEGDDTKGEKDIYISFRQANGAFEYPVNIGSTINTELQEFDPFLAADLQTLYFTRGVNEKESKIFVSRRLDDTWKRWSEPIALPKPINLQMTHNSGAFVTADGKTLYFASDRRRGTDRDIYSVELDDLLSPTAAHLVKGKLVCEGRTLENAVVEVQSLQNKVEKKQDVSYAQSNENGGYEMPFRNTEKVAISASKKGYISEVVISSEPAEASKNIEMTKLEKGNRFTLKNILFERSKASFLPISIPELENLKNVLLTNPKLIILIEGHTDSNGKTMQASVAEKLQKLSKERADAVKNYLTNNGVASDRIETKGFGSSNPRFSNEIEMERVKNRRVEIVIL